MTQEQLTRLEELQNQVFQFVNSIQDDDERINSAINIVFQCINGAEHYWNDDHKFILNEAGKYYRKISIKIMIEDGIWNEIQDEISKK